MSLNAISIPPANGKPPTRLLVMLHGWGANAGDLAPLATVLNLPEYQFLFPNAPFSHPEVPGGRAWYSLESSEYEGLSESRQTLFDWLLSLEKTTGIPLSRTILSGFSQGGAMALDVGLHLPLAGLCSLSGYLQMQPQATLSPFPPILIIHGRQDMVIDIQIAQRARDELVALGANVEYHEFDMGHDIPANAIALLQQFILNRA